MSDVQDVQVGMKRSEAGDLVEFGVVLPNGGFYSFAATRSGDYDEALAADAQTQPQQTEQPQPDSQPTETQPPASEQPVQG